MQVVIEQGRVLRDRRTLPIKVKINFFQQFKLMILIQVII